MSTQTDSTQMLVTEFWTLLKPFHEKSKQPPPEVVHKLRVIAADLLAVAVDLETVNSFGTSSSISGRCQEALNYVAKAFDLVIERVRPVPTEAGYRR